MSKEVTKQTQKTMVTLIVYGETVELTDRQYAMITDSVALAVEILADNPGGTEAYSIPETIKLKRILPASVHQQRRGWNRS